MTVQNHNQEVAEQRPATDVQNPVAGTATARRLPESAWPIGTKVMILSRFTRLPGYTGTVVGYGTFQTGAIGTLVQIREGEPPLLVNNSLLVQ